MTRKRILEICCFLLFFLFAYTSMSKMFDYGKYLGELRAQTLLAPFAVFLSFFLPCFEVLIAFLLLLEKGRKIGLIGAIILMALFTFYVSYVMIFQSHWPCSCGGIVSFLTWPQHLVFNIFFLTISVVGFKMQTLTPSEKLSKEGTKVFMKQ